MSTQSQNSSDQFHVCIVVVKEQNLIYMYTKYTTHDGRSATEAHLVVVFRGNSWDGQEMEKIKVGQLLLRRLLANYF